MKKIAYMIGLVIFLSGCSFNGFAPVEPETVQPSASETTMTTTPTESRGPSESELKRLYAADLADSLLFTFDNFQCGDGDDCKAIYEVRYFGSKNRHAVRALYSSKVSGYISSSSGNQADLGIIAIQDSAGLAFGFLERDVVYRAIINFTSKLHGEYDSIYLESHGEVLLHEYFGCFKSEAQFVSSTPTC